MPFLASLWPRKRHTDALVVELPAPCSFDCAFCTYNKHPPDDGRLDRALRDIAAVTDHDELVLTGPDPLAFPGALEMLRRATARFRSVIVQTPGARLRDPELWKFVMATPSIKLQIPIYGSARERHEPIMRGVGTFDVIMDLLRERPRTTRFHTIVLASNLDDIGGIVALVRGYGAELGFRILAAFDTATEGPARYQVHVVSQTDAIRAIVPHLDQQSRGEFLSQNRAVLLPCVLRRELGVRDRDMPLVRRTAQRSETEPCAVRDRCALAGVCPGVSPHYVSKFGTSELEPARF